MEMLKRELLELKSKVHPTPSTNQDQPPSSIIAPIPKKPRRLTIDQDGDDEAIGMDDGSHFSMDYPIAKANISHETTKAVLGLLFARINSKPPHNFDLAITKPEADLLFNQKTIQSHWTRIHGQVKKKTFHQSTFSDHHHLTQARGPTHRSQTIDAGSTLPVPYREPHHHRHVRPRTLSGPLCTSHYSDGAQMLPGLCEEDQG